MIFSNHVIVFHLIILLLNGRCIWNITFKIPNPAIYYERRHNFSEDRMPTTANQENS